MIVAVAAAMTGASYAACKPGAAEKEDGCAVVFDLKASGKISGQNTADTYKKNYSLSAKGYMIINADYEAEVLANFKYQGKKINAALAGEVIEWGAYGKYLEKFEAGEYKPGKTYKFDSDLGVQFDGTTDADVNAYLSTFGKVKATVSKEKATGKGTCNPGKTLACEVTWTPVKYTGYFAGTAEACADQLIPEFECVVPPAELNLVGAKVTLKYNKKLVTVLAAESKFVSKYGKYTWEAPVTGTDLVGDFEGADTDDE